ncbi:MAG: hypothetical protein SFU57_00175 [Gemmatimonadales bacterium]|nr:hypothetical protein [Gemmatimonadales bacterium]
MSRLIKEVRMLSELWGTVLELNLRPPLRTDDTFQLTFRTAQRFFGLVCLSFGREVVLTLCRLSDPAVQFRNRNLSLPGILEFVPTDHPAHGRLTNAAQIVAEKRPELEKLRHKILAHLDDERGTDTTFNPSVDLQGIDRAVTACEDFVGALCEIIGEPVPSFADLAHTHPTGVNALLAALRFADGGPGTHWTGAGRQEGPPPTP